jgi:hypothetical protein
MPWQRTSPHCWIGKVPSFDAWLTRLVVIVPRHARPPAFDSSHAALHRYVTSNGYINIDKSNNASSTYAWDASADPIALTDTRLPSGISVAHEDLNPNASTTGAVLTYYDAIAGTFTISYQNILFYPSNGSMSAQAVLWADGTVDIRWGACRPSTHSFVLLQYPFMFTASEPLC